jgi:hypothetical protein
VRHSEDDAPPWAADLFGGASPLDFPARGVRRTPDRYPPLNWPARQPRVAESLRGSAESRTAMPGVAVGPPMHPPEQRVDQPDASAASPAGAASWGITAAPLWPPLPSSKTGPLSRAGLKLPDPNRFKRVDPVSRAGSARGEWLTAEPRGYRGTLTHWSMSVYTPLGSVPGRTPSQEPSMTRRCHFGPPSGSTDYSAIRGPCPWGRRASPRHPAVAGSIVPVRRGCKGGSPARPLSDAASWGSAGAEPLHVSDGTIGGGEGRRDRWADHGGTGRRIGTWSRHAETCGSPRLAPRGGAAGGARCVPPKWVFRFR